MVIDWLVYGFLVWGAVMLLNAIVFKDRPASRYTAWGLTIAVFLINMVVLTIIKAFRYKAIYDSLGGSNVLIAPGKLFDWVGAFVFSSMFFYLLRRDQGNKQILEKKLKEEVHLQEEKKPELQESSKTEFSKNSLNSPLNVMTGSDESIQQIDEAGLEEETKTCSACKQTIKLFAKKCRFCGAVFDQDQNDKSIKLKIIELLERKLNISFDQERTRCPACAELIKLKSFECELCGEKFNPDAVVEEIMKRQYDLLKAKGVCPKCFKYGVYVDYTGSFYCQNCKKYIIYTENK